MKTKKRINKKVRRKENGKKRKAGKESCKTIQFKTEKAENGKDKDLTAFKNIHVYFLLLFIIFLPFFTIRC